MPEKLGREKIQQLLRDAIAKYVKETGDEFMPNQSAANYTGLANKLSEISNELPAKYPEIFAPGTIGKYDITPAQVKGACLGHVESLKEHFKEALCIYIYGTLSKDVSIPKEQDEAFSINPPSQIEQIPPKKDFRKKDNILKAVCAILLIALLFLLFKWYQFETIRRDMRIVPYWPNDAEIKAVEGIYKVYTGSPQARISDKNRYHKVVWDIVDVKYKEGYGYFTFERYGPRLDHQGYMQFDGPNLVTIYADVTNNNTTRPKHSQFKLEIGKDIFSVMSTSWSWDTTNNEIIGIREVYIKLGRGGSIKKADDIFKPEKYQWIREDSVVRTFQPKIESLDTLPKILQELLNEKSIVLLYPDSTRFIKPGEVVPGEEVPKQ